MANRPSYAQQEGLVEFLEQNPGIAKGLLRTTQAKLENKRKWAELATSLNMLGGAHKDGQGWAKYWAEKKCALKRLCAQHAASIRRTGAGTASNLPTLSALDQRLISVMGGQDFATGSTGVAVNPFPELVQTRGVLTEASETEYEVVIPDIENNDITVRRLSPIPSTSRDDAIQVTPIVPPAPTPPQQQSRIPQPRRRGRRNSIQRPAGDMQQFQMIEERRVEAELITARAFDQLAQQTSAIANALTLIANAISEIARKMPSP